jgi:hypothetical protein
VNRIADRSIGELKAHWERELEEAVNQEREAGRRLSEARRRKGNAEEKLGHILALIEDVGEPTPSAEEREVQGEPVYGAAESSARELAREKIVLLLPRLDRPWVLREFKDYLFEHHGLDITKGTMHRALRDLTNDGLLAKIEHTGDSRDKFAYEVVRK